jgi:hypothetical protein
MTEPTRNDEVVYGTSHRKSDPTLLDSEIRDILAAYWLDATSSTIRNPLKKAGYDATERIKALIATETSKARLKGVEEVLYRLRQAPPIGWIDAQTWIDNEYNRLQELIK